MPLQVIAFYRVLWIFTTFHPLKHQFNDVRFELPDCTSLHWIWNIFWIRVFWYFRMGWVTLLFNEPLGAYVTIHYALCSFYSKLSLAINVSFLVKYHMSNENINGGFFILETPSGALFIINPLTSRSSWYRSACYMCCMFDPMEDTSTVCQLLQFHHDISYHITYTHYMRLCFHHVLLAVVGGSQTDCNLIPSLPEIHWCPKSTYI